MLLMLLCNCLAVQDDIGAVAEEMLPAVRAGPDGWPRLHLDDAHWPGVVFAVDSWIRKSLNAEAVWDFRAKCGACGKEKNRTSKPGRGGQGRPVAALVKWLSFACGGRKDAHQALGFPAPYAERVPFRRWLGEWARAHDFTKDERRVSFPALDDDLGEPRILP
jgi:hypothetical protein